MSIRENLLRTCDQVGFSMSLARDNAARRVDSAKEDVENGTMNAHGALMYWLFDASLYVLYDPELPDASRIPVLGEVTAATLAEFWKEPMFAEVLEGLSKDVTEHRQRIEAAQKAGYTAPTFGDA